MPLSSRQAEDQAKLLKSFQDSERSKLDVVRRYWKGKQDLPAVIPRTAPHEVRNMARIARVNACNIVVDTLTQSTFVEGFRGSNESDNHEVWQAWQANRMDSRQSGVHRAAFGFGTSYVIVLPGDRGPVVRGVSPRRLTVVYGEDPFWPVWALEKWDDRGYRLYDDEAVYFLGEERSLASPAERKLVHIDTQEHNMGVCPVVRFVDAEDLDAEDDVDNGVLLGQVAPLMELQDQIDLTTFGLLVAQHYGAFRQRVVMGWVDANEVEAVKMAASQIMVFKDHPDDVRIDEFEQSDLSGYINSREATLKYLATISQTPVHELTGQLVNLSAEALAAAEAGRDRKVEERKTSFGESWEQVFGLVGMLIGSDVPEDSQVVWRDTSARAFAATIDALGKAVQLLHIPPQALWERFPGATQQDVEMWKRMAEEPDELDRLQQILNRQLPDDEADEVA